MSGDPNALPWEFVKARTRTIVRDANGHGPLFVIEGGANEEAVQMIQVALAATYAPLGWCKGCNHRFESGESQYRALHPSGPLCASCADLREGLGARNAGGKSE